VGERPDGANAPTVRLNAELVPVGGWTGDGGTRFVAVDERTATADAPFVVVNAPAERVGAASCDRDDAAAVMNASPAVANPDH